MKILFIRLSSLGDIVLTEPAPRLARETYPQAEIHYLTKPIYADMVQDFSSVDKVYKWENKRQLIKTLRAEQYDFIIDLHSKLNTFLAKVLAKGKKVITYNKQHLLRQMIVKKLSNKSIDSVVVNYLEAVERMRIQLPPYPPSKRGVETMSPSSEGQMMPILHPNRTALNEVNEIFENYNIPRDKYLIGLFPGATHSTKQLPVEKYANFLLDIPDDWRCAILVMGDWKDKYLALKIKSLTGMNVYDLTGAFTITQLIAAVSKLEIVLSNDSGPMHIAAALKKPQIAVWGTTHTRLGFRPLNDKAVIIEKELPCRPCSLHGDKYCPKRHFKCMYQINSREIFVEFKELFDNIIGLPAKSSSSPTN